MKTWYKCPVCGQKLLMIDDSKEISGVFIQCKKHHGEIEVKNKSQSQSQSRPIDIGLVSQNQNQS